MGNGNLTRKREIQIYRIYLWIDMEPRGIKYRIPIQYDKGKERESEEKGKRK